MNQFSKYRFIATVATSAASKWVGHSVVSTVFALAVTLVFGSCNLSAQQTQNFAPPRDAFTSVRNSTAQNQNGWQQPANIQTSNHLPQATRLKPPSNAWPAEPVTFDSQVSHAKFESGVSSLDSANENQSTTLQTTLASSGAMLAYVKDGLLAKAGEMFGGDKSQPGKLNITKMLSSLAIVLGGYFAFVWVVRKFNPGANSQLPPDVVQVLGKTPFGTRQTLQVVRLGSKLVLLLNGADGTFPMGEVTDPDEVNRSWSRWIFEFKHRKLIIATYSDEAASASCSAANGRTSIRLSTGGLSRTGSVGAGHRRQGNAKRIGEYPAFD
jgi:flagellar biogenesis protein FliO